MSRYSLLLCLMHFVGQTNLCVEFKSRFLRSSDAVLILVGQRLGSASGTTLVFKLTSVVDCVTPMVINDVERLVGVSTIFYRCEDV